MPAPNNRIDPIAVTPSIARQTPDNEFGTVLARTMGEAASKGAGLIGSVTGITPITSAAVTSMQTVSGLAASGVGGVRSASGRAVSTVGTSAGASPTTAGGTGTVAGDGDPSTQQLLNEIASGDDKISSAAYLQLQMKMQDESQQFSAMSNVLKVRSDSAKAAINNIR